MKARIFVLLWLLVGTSVKVAAESKPIVAVFDVEAKGTGTLDPAFLDGLADVLSARLAECGSFQMVPRSALKERLKDSKRESFKACYDSACQIELGRELAAEMTLASQVVRLGSSCTVTLTLYDLKQAATRGAATAECACDADGVLGAVKVAAAKLCDGSGTETLPAAKSLPVANPQPLSLNASQFRQVIEAHRDDFLTCVRPRKKFLGKCGARRNVTVEITVRADGQVSQMSIRPKQLARRTPARCLKKVLRGLRFPKAQQASTHKHVFRIN